MGANVFSRIINKNSFAIGTNTPETIGLNPLSEELSFMTWFLALIAYIFIRVSTLLFHIEEQ